VLFTLCLWKWHQGANAGCSVSSGGDRASSNQWQRRFKVCPWPIYWKYSEVNKIYALTGRCSYATRKTDACSFDFQQFSATRPAELDAHCRWLKSGKDSGAKKAQTSCSAAVCAGVVLTRWYRTVTVILVYRYHSRSFQIIPDHSRSFQIIPDHSRSFQIIPDHSRSFQIIPDEVMFYNDKKGINTKWFDIKASISSEFKLGLLWNLPGCKAVYAAYPLNQNNTSHCFTRINSNIVMSSHNLPDEKDMEERDLQHSEFSPFCNEASRVGWIPISKLKIINIIPMNQWIDESMNQ